MATWKAHKKELLKAPEFKAAYDALEPEFEVARSLIQARIDHKLTQEQLAEQAGVSRVVIARLESGTTNPTLATLNKVAHALGQKISFVNAK